MTEPLVGTNLQPQACFPFYMRMLDCFKTEPAASKLCLHEFEDFYECKLKKKERAFQAYANSELRKLKIYSLPRYDESSDTFVDGELPADIDGYFCKDKAERTHYSS